MDGSAITVPLDEPLSQRLDAMARTLNLSREDVVRQALAHWLESEQDDLRRIGEGIAAADRGDLVPEAEMEAFFAKWRDAR